MSKRILFVLVAGLLSFVGMSLLDDYNFKVNCEKTGKVAIRGYNNKLLCLRVP